MQLVFFFIFVLTTGMTCFRGHTFVEVSPQSVIVSPLQDSPEVV